MSQKIEEGYKEMLGDDTPNVISISYHGKPLSKHSLGQRASALILFILTQHDSDVIVVDQPEDDLDNQVIYEELIQTIKKKRAICNSFLRHITLTFLCWEMLKES